MSLNQRMLILPLILMTFTIRSWAQTGPLTTSTTFHTHPRILFFSEDEAQLKSDLEKDKLSKSIHLAIIQEADRLINVDPIQRIQIGRRLLDKSREALRRIFQLSYAYRTTKDKKYLARTEKEMLTIAGFSDWNPSHFLDVAEMTMAMAIGYDWLYHDLSEGSRNIIQEAIVKKGLEPSLEAKYSSWLKADHNWNQVCNAGMTYGAMAVYENHQELAINIINRAIESIKIPMKDYGPDGIYPEGYGYWGYGTSFNIMFLSAVEKLFNSDFGLNKAPGFLKTASFLEHMTGPTGKPFNYSDAGNEGGFHPAQFWIANKINDPAVLWEEKNYLQRNGINGRVNDRLLPALLFWKGKINMDMIPAPKELMFVGQGKNPIAMMRTSWIDPNAIYVATKGGSANINHAHMDIGSFIMDANGERWAMDFGMQNYESLESKGIKLFGRTQDAERWNVFRLNNFVHNTLTVDSQLQRVNGNAPMIASGNNPDQMFATYDLSTVYDQQLRSAKRNISILYKNQVVVKDELETLNKTTTIRWTMLTPADAIITGKNEITLTKNGKMLKLMVSAPAGKLSMKTWSTEPPNHYDAPNPGTILVGFELILPANTKITTSVYLLPEGVKQDKDIELIRSKIKADIIAPSVNTTAVTKISTSLRADGTWSDINYIDTSRTGFHHRVHLERLEQMCRAYTKSTSSLKGNAGLKLSIDKALKHWLDKDYICANWWWNEIGTPNYMIDMLFMLDEELTTEQKSSILKIASRASLDSGVGPRPGGDLIKIAGMLGKRGLFMRDVAIVERVIAVIAGEIRISTERGLKPDMSFHHRTDGVTSILTYGMAYPITFAYWNRKIEGTRFTFPEEAMKLLVDYYVDGITKSMAFAKYPDIGAKNRDLSRRDNEHDAVSPELAMNISAGTTYRKEELGKIIASQKGITKPEFEWNRFYPYSEYYTHQRPTWFSSVRMHSIRQNNVESPYNEEGLKNHHLADGANYITITGKEYTGISPVWDWQKIPGTTILQKKDLPHFNEIVKEGKSKHVGAVSNGSIGAATMHLVSVHDPLEAKKSWFFFKDGYVCLGAGISNSGNLLSATTVNQALLKGEVKLKKDGQISSLPKGNRLLNKIEWINHANVFYFFPENYSVNIKNDVAFGNWRSINHQEWATFDTVKKDVFLAWFDHPGNKTKSSYAYKVIPGSIQNNSLAEKNATALAIIENNENIQAVMDKSNDIFQAVFFDATSMNTNSSLGIIKVDQPTIIMIEGMNRKNFTVHISDPLRNKSKITLSINGQHNFTNINETWDSKENRTIVEIPMPDGLEKGKTVSITTTI
ncbi:MAG: polysaccharide lyase family 8 super-sandwich domain-containing protein [Sphingobacteriales bacterium]